MNILSRSFLMVMAITYLSLVIGEVAPKGLALDHPEQVASLVAGPCAGFRT